MALKKVSRTNDAFLKDVEEARQQNGLHLWWLGQSGFLCGYRGRWLLFDPYLSDSLTTKYEHTDKPHVRISERVIEPRKLDFIDVVTSSHNHTDHLDAETLIPLFEVNPQLRLVLPEANREFAAERLKLNEADLVGLDAGDTAEVGNFRFTGIAAAHEAIERDAAGRCKYLGWIVQIGDHTIYHSGDTIRYDGLIETLGAFSIDVAILPINGRKPERRVSGNLNGAEAATLARAVGARWVIPCHYGMFEFNTVSPDLFITSCRSIGQSCKVMAQGEGWTIPRC